MLRVDDADGAGEGGADFTIVDETDNTLSRKGEEGREGER